VQSPFTGAFLLTQPAFQLFRSMRGSIVQDEPDGVDLPPKGFRNDLLLYKGLEIDKAFALTTGPVDLALRKGAPGKQMSSATTMIACFVQHRLASLCWARWLLTLSRLNGRFLICTDQPRSFFEQSQCPLIQLQDGGEPVPETFADSGYEARHGSATDGCVPL